MMLPHENVCYLFDAYELHSEWPKLRPVSSISSSVIIYWLRHLSATFGLPDEVITDKNRQFIRYEFDKFLTDYGIQQMKTANNHPQQNPVKRFNRLLFESLRIA